MGNLPFGPQNADVRRLVDHLSGELREEAARMAEGVPAFARTVVDTQAQWRQLNDRMVAELESEVDESTLESKNAGDVLNDVARAIGLGHVRAVLDGAAPHLERWGEGAPDREELHFLEAAAQTGRPMRDRTIRPRKKPTTMPGSTY